MEKIWKNMTGVLFSAATYLGWLLGGWDAALGIMFIFMGVDYVTGVMAAFHGSSDKTPGGGFSSRAAFVGVTRKLVMLLIIMLAAALDRLMGTQGVCRIASIGFYVANEGMSIVENAARLGVPFPRALLRVLETLREKDENAGI
ncbi:MAG: phage holin family protein [Clostridia bacterium]|nr:phage holin family protein [Clostridia bacterium]